jgi:hypothetical protein
MRSPLGLVIFAVMLMASSMLMLGRAQAAPISTADGIRTAADTLKLVERTHYVWNGRNYCWTRLAGRGPDGTYAATDLGSLVSGGEAARDGTIGIGTVIRDTTSNTTVNATAWEAQGRSPR